MFSRQPNYQIVKEGQKRVVKLEGISKDYFEAIVQYWFSDSFIQPQSEPNSLTFHLTLLIYTDYFVLTGLVDICSQIISDCISVNNVL
jgi:hypothetical protein